MVTNGFFPKVALTTRIEDSSSSLIDNIFTNDTEEKEIAEILLNRLSDHQIMFTYIHKLSYIDKVPKVITIEKNNSALFQNLIREKMTLNVYDGLNISIDSNPKKNYEILIIIIIIIIIFI